MFKIHLSQNKFLNKEAQLILVFNSNYCTISNLARNPSVSTNVQLILAKDENVYVRAALAQNTSIDENTQSILVKGDQWTKECLARNPSLDYKIIKILSKDRNKWIRANLEKTYKFLKNTTQLLNHLKDNV